VTDPFVDLLTEQLPTTLKPVAITHSNHILSGEFLGDISFGVNTESTTPEQLIPLIIDKLEQRLKEKTHD
jgi:hypothetical protein